MPPGSDATRALHNLVTPCPPTETLEEMGSDFVTDESFFVDLVIVIDGVEQLIFPVQKFFDANFLSLPSVLTFLRMAWSLLPRSNLSQTYSRKWPMIGRKTFGSNTSLT